MIRHKPDRPRAELAFEDAAAPVSASQRSRVSQTIVRIAREDRAILDALAAFDRGKRPTA